MLKLGIEIPKIYKEKIVCKALYSSSPLHQLTWRRNKNTNATT